MRNELPAAANQEGRRRAVWRLTYNTILKTILTNSDYAGAYAFSRTKVAALICQGESPFALLIAPKA